jgi:hypothetical protein
MEVNCAEACTNGCVLGDQCPHLEYRQAASQFINDTSIDKILAIAEESVRKKFLQNAQNFRSDLPE